MVSHHISATSSIFSPATAPGSGMSGVRMERPPRILRPAILFGKPYVWVRLRDGRLALYPDPPRRAPTRTETALTVPGKTVTVTVSDELAELFEAHAHLLAPARIVGRDSTTNPCWLTYTLDWPGAPADAASVVPIWQASYQGNQATVSLLHLDWYDAQGHALPAPPAHAPAQ